MPIHLLIVDDHELVRDGLRMTFDGTEILVVADAADGIEAIEQLDRHQVDVALVDLRMPRADGLHFLRLMKQQGRDLPCVLMHTIQDGSNVARECRELGAKGLVLKGREREELIDAIYRVHAGESLWSDSI